MGKKEREIYTLTLEMSEVERLKKVCDWALKAHVFSEFEDMFSLKCIDMALGLKLSDGGKLNESEG